VAIRAIIATNWLGPPSTENFRLEQVPVSPYVSGYVDLEGLAIFKEIDDYFGNHSEEYTISDDRYFNLIDLSDEKCIVIGDKNAVFLLNKMTGLVKLLYNRPQQFVEDFKNNRLTWIFD